MTQMALELFNPPAAHQVFFINGPRRSGKDTATKFIMDAVLTSRHMKISGVLKDACRELFGINWDTYRALEQIGGAIKTQPQPALFGHSWVDTLIWLSEDCMKPKFGAGVLGEVLLRKMIIPTLARLTVISDAGFEEEALPIIAHYKPTNCHVFRLHRPGHTFEGDSRSYVFENGRNPPGLNCMDIDNQHDMLMFKVQILRRVYKVMGIDSEVM